MTVQAVNNNNGGGEQIIKRTTTTRRYNGSSGGHHHHSHNDNNGHGGASGGGNNGSPTIIIVNGGGGGGARVLGGGRSRIDGGSLEDLLLADGFPGSRGFDYGNSRSLDRPSFLRGGYLDRDYAYGRGRGGYRGNDFYANRSDRRSPSYDGGLTGNRALNGVIGAVGGATAASAFGGSAIGGGGGAAIGQIFGDNPQDAAIIGGLSGAAIDIGSQFLSDDVDINFDSFEGFTDSVGESFSNVDWGSAFGSGIGALTGALTT